MKNMGWQIVVLSHGFVYVGEVVIDGGFVEIAKAKNIRKWGTSAGLGELTGGPTKSTEYDETGTVIAPLQNVIHLIKCNPWR